jgi:hypothetical protein
LQSVGNGHLSRIPTTAVQIIASDMVHVSNKGGPSPVVQPSAASHLDESVEGDPSVASGQEDTNKGSSMGCGLLDVLTEMVSSDGGTATPQEDLPRSSKRKSNRKLLSAGSSLKVGCNFYNVYFPRSCYSTNSSMLGVN